MPETEGRRKKVILYARSATAVEGQIEALREHAERSGYEVAEEVSDTSQSGAELDGLGIVGARGLDAGAVGVSAVLAVDRGRFARVTLHRFLSGDELRGRGC